MNHPPLVCPRCRQTLTDAGDQYNCDQCGSAFPVRFGVPDLREPSTSLEDELAYCEELVAASETSTFSELMLAHMDRYKLPRDLRRIFERNQLESVGRGEHRLHMIEHVLRDAERGLNGRQACLDVGCGTGSGLCALARQFRQAVGLDLSLPLLIIARKLLKEQGLGHVRLVCGSAEALPFPDDSFDLVNASDVIEHLADKRNGVAEARRVLTPDSHFYFNSPNRFNLLSPEPHVNLWWMGLLPRRWMDSYVRLRRNKPYGVRLSSLCEVRKILRESFGHSFLIHGLILNRSRRIRSFRDALYRTPGVAATANFLLKPVIPQFQVLAWKQRRYRTP